MIDSPRCQSVIPTSTGAGCRALPRLAAGLIFAAGLSTLVSGCRTEHTMNVREAKNIVWTVSTRGLDAGLLLALERAACRYHRATGKPITITSGRRTLRHQARLMAAMSPEQLEGMYCRHGYPSYIRELIAASRKKHAPLTEDEAYEILKSRTEGYISTHLSGAAVDVSPKGMDVPLLKRLLAQAGFRTLDERNLGIACIHATFKAAPVRIVRK
jgi:hypothetical protein